MNDVTGELSAYDQHPADYGSQMFEREKDIGLFQSLENQLNLVDQALAKIEQGNYGTCEQCKSRFRSSFKRIALCPAVC